MRTIYALPKNLEGCHAEVEDECWKGCKCECAGVDVCVWVARLLRVRVRVRVACACVRRVRACDIHIV